MTHELLLTSTLLYLDPGSGSLILKLLIAALLGAGLMIRAYWRRIKSFLFKGSAKPAVLDEEDD
jgi:hypothetical protein